MNGYATIWLVLLVIFLIMEGACPIHLVSVWFAIGALIAGILAILECALWLQITVFLVVSCAMLAAMLPLVRKFLKPKIVKTNIDSVIGSQGYVTEAVDNLTAAGQVKLGAMPWTARSETGKQIPAGTLVRVTRIEGVKVFVTPVEPPAGE